MLPAASPAADDSDTCMQTSGDLAIASRNNSPRLGNHGGASFGAGKYFSITLNGTAATIWRR